MPDGSAPSDGDDGGPESGCSSEPPIEDAGLLSGYVIAFGFVSSAEPGVSCHECDESWSGVRGASPVEEFGLSSGGDVGSGSFVSDASAVSCSEGVDGEPGFEGPKEPPPRDVPFLSGDVGGADSVFSGEAGFSWLEGSTSADVVGSVSILSEESTVSWPGGDDDDSEWGVPSEEPEFGVPRSLSFAEVCFPPAGVSEGWSVAPDEVAVSCHESDGDGLELELPPESPPVGVRFSSEDVDGFESIVSELSSQGSEDDRAEFEIPRESSSCGVCVCFSEGVDEAWSRVPESEECVGDVLDLDGPTEIPAGELSSSPEDVVFTGSVFSLVLSALEVRFPPGDSVIF